MLIHDIAKSIRTVEETCKSLYWSFSSLVKVIILSKYKIVLPKSTTSDCVILGNGPSLKKSLEIHESLLKKKTLFCVNNFATTKEYRLYKPSQYVILDPGFFIYKQRPDIVATFNELKNNTTWEVNLFIPFMYRKDADVVFLKRLNSFVRVHFYNYTIAKGFYPLVFFLFRKNLAMQQFYNVLGASIFLAINMQYKKIWILGADHSWFDNIVIDEKNQLCRRDMHFYDDEPPLLSPIIEPVSGEVQKVGNFFQALQKVFNSYYQLEKYAISRNCSIYNASEFSYIDAFERKSLEL
ncbi:MAG TPA: hypothetical protein VK766_04120 [Cytophagaceae bacterium]|jgi:hypothetical protein|nr:hypothetical protein [Cytophagaceae bacterium]